MLDIRDLQTTPIVPPGAFPNGQGTGEQYDSEIPGWYISLSGQESANTLATWTAEQEALDREAGEAVCKANPAACITEEDPGWVWTLTIKQAYVIANAIFSAASANTALHFIDAVTAALKNWAGIDFIVQIKEAVEEGVFGFSRDEVEKWGLNLAASLSSCVWDAETQMGKPKNPHCWVYVPTKKYHIGFTIFGQFIGFVFEIPEFKKDTEVGYCPHGSSYCYGV